MSILTNTKKLRLQSINKLTKNMKRRRVRRKITKKRIRKSLNSQ